MKEENTGYKPDPDLPGTLRMYLDNVQYCVDSPKKQIFNKGCMYVKMNDYFVVYDQYMEPSSILIFDVDVSKITEPSNVIEEMDKQFISACRTGTILADDYGYTINKKEDKTINGYDMCRFEVSQRLYELETILDENGFCRCSKSVIVNLNQIQSLTPEINRTILAAMNGGDRITISRRYVKAFLNKLSI